VTSRTRPRPAHRVYYQAADREVAPLKKLPSCLREQLDLRDLPIERRQSGRHLLHGAQRGRTAGPWCFGLTDSTLGSRPSAARATSQRGVEATGRLQNRNWRPPFHQV